MENLKPCPFCGNTDIDLEVTDLLGKDKICWSVGCKQCGAYNELNYTKQQAIDCWNMRKEQE